MGKIGICSSCGEEKEILAKGLCSKCYQNQPQRKEYLKEYQKMHKEEISKKNKEKYYKNLEQEKERHKKYYEEHKKEIIKKTVEYRREKRKTDPEFHEKEKLRNKKYKEEHKDYFEQWELNNKDKRKQYTDNSNKKGGKERLKKYRQTEKGQKNRRKNEKIRRARKKECKLVEFVDLKVLYDKYDGICQSCGKICDWEDFYFIINKNGNEQKVVGSNYPTHDHIIPISKQGEESYKNAQLLCFSCNSKKYNKIINVVGVKDNDVKNIINVKDNDVEEEFIEKIQ